MNKGNKNKWWLNGGRDSGRTIRLLCEVYENKIAELQHKVDTLQGFLDHDIEYDMYKTIQGLRKENAELKNRDCWKSCEYANPKSELIAQHIKDVQQLTKAKELLQHFISMDLFQIAENDQDYNAIEQAEQFLSGVEK